MKRLLCAIAFVLAFASPHARADTINVGTLAKANDTIQISAPNMATVNFVVSGTFSATITPQTTLDGTTWQTATVIGPYPSTSTVTSITGAGTYQFAASGWAYFRLIATSFTSGTVNVTEYASAASSGSGSTGNGGSVTQGTSPWVIGQSSGSNLHVNVDSAVSSTPVAIAYTDNSSTVTAGGTSQQITAANANRHVLLFYNLSAQGGDILYLNFGAAASSTNSIPIYPGGGWQSDPQTCPSGTINVLGATTGDKYMEKEN